MRHRIRHMSSLAGFCLCVGDVLMFLTLALVSYLIATFIQSYVRFEVGAVLPLWMLLYAGMLLVCIVGPQFIIRALRRWAMWLESWHGFIEGTECARCVICLGRADQLAACMHILYCEPCAAAIQKKSGRRSMTWYYTRCPLCKKIIRNLKKAIY